ncbi:MAG: hypothetical protein BWY41_00112 [Candidatus Atribacteria bacterium ADurb.Bin276]|uniref:Uncharacterized protein n=1 Tax=Candidatus Atribacter allofermentans TaxID=1852833 RepID=A0A1V5T5C8_9BACT|nr:MAG: hypothetical protein BWY41_00112 [Candidatus Atribacteria bacterium ADurb.Bin276]
MELNSNFHDRAGNLIGETYSLILQDPFFENKLRNFDPNLRLTFDQIQKKWVVLEAAPDGSGWNVILACEDEDGNPKAPGEWVLNRLYVYRQRYEAKREMGIDEWFKRLKSDLDAYVEKKEQQISDDHQAMLREDVVQWRKAAKELEGLPVSDATAGYRKVSYEKNDECNS